MMASSLCKSTVLKVYHEIMDDVVAGVRELFLEDGVDEQILQELKQSWETKLLATKAVDTQTDIEKQVAMVKKEATSNGQVFNHKNHPQQLQHQQHQHVAAQHAASAPAQPVTSNNIAGPTSQQQHQQAPPTVTTATVTTSNQQAAQQSLLKQEPVAAHAQPPAPAQLVAEPAKQVPIQITLPQQPGADGPRVLTIQVPVSALQGNQLHKVLTGPVITATMGLPHAIASTLLQQHVNAAFNQHHPPPSAAAAIAAAAATAAAPSLATGNGMVHAPTAQTAAPSANAAPTQNNVPKTLAQGDAAYDHSDDDLEEMAPARKRVSGVKSVKDVRRRKRRSRCNKESLAPLPVPKTLAEAEAVLAGILSDLSLDASFLIPQCDGNLMDTSDEDDEPTDEDEPSDEDYDKQDEEDQEMEDGGPEEEPLNSGDDVTDEDSSELFDTDNVVVCQYDKITRARNKWKFHLKDGIMNLNGEDYVFQKASGDAEW